jgi:endonuclease YncB( thermonuclease family)
MGIKSKSLLRIGSTILAILATLLIAFFRQPDSDPSDRTTGSESTLHGKVLSVADGDTFTLQVEDRKIKVRLQGIDCPERDQAFGKQAGDFIRDRVGGERVEVRKLGVDPYDRVLGEVFFENDNLNKELLKNGFAWWYEQHAPDRSDYRELQREARAEKRGLWSDVHAIAPWEFRKNRREQP